MAANRRSTRPSLISQGQSHRRSAAEDMMELSLTRAPLRRGSGGEPDDGSSPRADLQRRYQASCVDDPVEARAIWYVAPRSGAVMCPAYVARPLGPLALMQSAAWLPNRFTRWNGA